MKKGDRIKTKAWISYKDKEDYLFGNIVSIENQNDYFFG